MKTKLRLVTSPDSQAAQPTSPDFLAVRILLQADSKFADRLVKVGECLLWTGATHWGYGLLERKGKRWKAHRYAWSLVYGKIPAGMCVLHSHTGNRNCVNPLHLRLGTYADNNLDTIAHGMSSRSRTHCKHGHEYTIANTRYYNSGRHRQCKTCCRNRAKIYAAIRRKNRSTSNPLNFLNAADQVISTGRPK